MFFCSSSHLMVSGMFFYLRVLCYLTVRGFFWNGGVELFYFLWFFPTRRLVLRAFVQGGKLFLCSKHFFRVFDDDTIIICSSGFDTNGKLCEDSFGDGFLFYDVAYALFSPFNVWI